MNYQSNPQLELAFNYVIHTDKNIFLTGKAGTGKTTFLHQIKQTPLKRMAVVAPTGVAAINAGGMTIHSFFQLPFGPFLPGNTQDINRQRRFSREKIRVIQSLDLLVIDEISMVRADLLDGIDDVLRRYKDRNKPFGGVQLLMIGDLHQLPPVVKDDEWDLLRDLYQTPYFFSSRALQQTRPVAIELKHIFRQSDATFIELLNKVRDNTLDAEVLETLNSRFVANFQPPEEDAYITLTSHNAAAHEINAEKLGELPGKLKRFKAEISGDFPPHAYPTEVELEFKTGAQVMFVKNDLSREKRYYNGKIGQITGIRDDTIYVKCPGEREEIEVQSVTWENVKYTLDEQSKEVQDEVIGQFTQHPLKLAWAITIHKSQGLTFERVIIDAQAAFAHGQVYVALSRCKSFEGIVLRSKIIPSSVRTDAKVKNYTDEADKNAPDENHLRQSRISYQQTLILELFGFSSLKRHFERLNRVFMEHENALMANSFQAFKALLAEATTAVFPVADKFRAQLQTYFAQDAMPEENEELQERIRKAAAWFSEKMGDGWQKTAGSLHIVTENKAISKTLTEALENLQKEIFVKNTCFGAVAQSGFLTQDYLRIKGNAELDFQASKRQAAPGAGTSGVPKNIPHPELYAQLRKWREDMAEELDVELFAVLPNKSLVDMVSLLPVSLTELKKVQGIGKGKLKQFGDELVGLVRKYCQSLDMPIPEPPPPPPPKIDTKTQSFDLFKSGKTIDEIAAERGLVRSTIEGHLAHFIRLGELDIMDVMEHDAIVEICNYFSENGPVPSGEAKAHFGEKYTYGELKMVQKFVERAEEEGYD